jgi:hypothetical protein
MAKRVRYFGWVAGVTLLGILMQILYCQALKNRAGWKWKIKPYPIEIEKASNRPELHEGEWHCILPANLG